MVALLSTFAAMSTFISNLWHLFKKPKYRAGVVWLFLLLLVGTLFYHQVEGWEWLDALYFSVITLSTVGYGDMSPTTTGSKIFTMVYILLGISIFVSFASMLASERKQMHASRKEKANNKDQPPGEVQA